MLFAAALAFSTSALCYLVRPRIQRSGRSTSGARLRDSLLSALPLGVVFFVFSATIVNVLWLGSRTSAASLLTDVLLLGLSVACAVALARLGRMPARLLLALGGVALVAVSFWIVWPRLEPRASTGGGADPGRPHIVFVLVDTLRADHLGLYGYSRATSPFLDEIATQSLVFDSAYSTSNWTRPAVASIFTSTMPSRHGAVVHHRAPAAELPLLAAELQRTGYRTGFFTAGVNVEASDGYDHGVDHFYSAHQRNLLELTAMGRNWLLPLRRRWRGARSKADDAVLQVRPTDLVERALAWQSEQPTNRPLFLYVHFHGPHTPYAPPAPFDRAFGDRPVDRRLTRPPRPWAGPEALSAEDRHQMVVQYDGEVRWHDDGIRALVAGLRESGRLENAILVVTSDHGEAFGEHGAWGHNAALFDEITRVPLLLWSSGGRLAPGRSSTPVSLIDLAPTLMDLAGLEPPAAFDGGSLGPWIRGERTDSRVIFFENPLNDEMGVRTAEWIYFEGLAGDNSRRWLFEARDTAQADNLAGRFPEVADRLSRLVVGRREADRGRALPSREIELDEQRIEELKDLGYLQ
jgi:arylsulfatase